MNILILIGQRKESYVGEYSPEALAVIDEVANDDNPDYLKTELKKLKESNDFESLVVLTVDVNSAKIMSLLRPNTKALTGEIVGHEGGPVVDRSAVPKP